MKVINGIFKLMIGCAVVLFSVAAVIYSSQNAQAELPTHSNSALYQSGSSGKYQFDYSVGQVDQTGAFYWQVMIFNSETGAYKAYYWSKSDQTWYENFNSSTPIPSLP